MRLSSNLPTAVAAVALLSACGSNHSGAVADAGDKTTPARGGPRQKEPSLPKSFVADLSDGIGRVEVKDDNVEVGYLPGPNGTAGMFSVGGSAVINGKTVSVSVGPVSGLAFKPGAAGTGMVQVAISSGDNGSDENATRYNSLQYGSYFGTKSSEDDDMPNLEFTQVEELKSEHALLTRYHVVGKFRFKVAYAPDPSSAACQQDAAVAAASGGRTPMFNASLCGAKKAEGQGTFDIVQDFLKVNGK